MGKRARIAPGGADAAAEVGDLNEQGELPLFFPALAIEGMATSDRRTIKPGALSHRALPFSILAQYRNPGSDGGHSGAEVIGHMNEMWRTPGPEVTSRETGKPFPEGTFVWQGRGVADPDTVGGSLARKGHLRGNSVDLSELDFAQDFAEDGKDTVTILSGKIAATTLCPIPAFADAYVAIGEDEEPAEAAEKLDSTLVAAGVGPDVCAEIERQYEAMVAAGGLPMFRAADLGDECGLCSVEDDDAEWTLDEATGEFSPTVAKRKRAFARGLAMKGEKADGSDAAYPIENQADADKAANMRGSGSADTSAVVAHIKKAVRKLGLTLPKSLTAAAEEQLPPIALFADPHLSAPSPISVGAERLDGRREISGHIATWGTCHASYGNACVRPPHSRTDYARFATGAIRVDDGGTPRVAAVGRITMSKSSSEGGHADGRLAEAAAVAHYDNTCTAVADVAAGEDAHGIWIHGLTRSGIDVDALLSAPPSGDWRNHEGNLELCAVLAVNTPGFPVPRSRVASGEAQSLVAAGMLKPGAEFAPAGGLTLASIRTVIDAALVAFFDPDNDGDIDRPMDDGSDDGTGNKPVKPAPPQAKGQAGEGAPPSASSKSVTAAIYKPQPYTRDPDETVKCPKCGKFNDTDARFCDQCGFNLVGKNIAGKPGSLTNRRQAALLEMSRAALLSDMGVKPVGVDPFGLAR
jgi:hypothetical protein